MPRTHSKIMQVVILHGVIDPQAGPDEQDTLEQVAAVSAALREQGHTVQELAADLNIPRLSQLLQESRPEMVFNLVETFGGTLRLSHVVPLLLEQRGIPFTGCGSSAIALTTDKIAAKALLGERGIPVLPSIYTKQDMEESILTPYPRWILKTRFEDGSLGLDDSCVLTRPQPEELWTALRRLEQSVGSPCFAEPYIEGRELNVSLLGRGEASPAILGVGEIEFKDFEAGKPRIVGYRAKWVEESYESTHTIPKVLSSQEDAALIRILSQLSAKIWSCCELKGYARADFRLDETGTPWLLEVNANPCIAKNAGFVRAAHAAGMSYQTLIDHLITEAHVGEK